MDGRQADRRQIFDVGLAGPIAGLILAVPIIVVWGEYAGFDRTRVWSF